VVEYCDIFGNSGGDIVNPAGGPPGIGQIVTTNAMGDPCDIYFNILLDPCFISPPADDMHLADTSPCQGAADPASACTTDIDLNLRPDPPGTLPDIGAYEHNFDAFASVPEQPDVLPLTYALSPNQPNPFSSFTEIRYALPRSSYVNLTVFSVRGRRLITLIDREEEAGYKSYRWRPDTLPSGIYFYRLRAGDFTETRKMVLLK
jgi:hypothetical protein